MKRLIKRYVLKAQVDRENDEVNEGTGERPQSDFTLSFTGQGSSMGLSGGGWDCLGSVFFMENTWLFSASRCIPMSWGDQGLHFLTEVHPEPKSQATLLSLH